MKMKKIGLFVLCVVFILLFGYTICSFGSSEIYSFDSPKNLYSECGTYVYNEKISEAYQVTVYGSPYGEFMESSAGRATKNGKKGEYQFQGYNFEGIAITNDRWFTEASNKGKVFSKNYSDVEWVISNPEAVLSWQKINSDPNLIKHITTSKFYDCDHVTLGVTDTGKTIIDLLGADYQDYAILMTDPSTGDSAHIKLHYKRHGYTTINYNSIVIKPMPYIKCSISAYADPMTIPAGQTQDVTIVINTEESHYTLSGVRHNDFTKREYWAGTGEIDGSEKVVSTDGVCTITVKDVSAGETITVWSKVYSEELEKLGYEHTAEATEEIYIGINNINHIQSEYALDYNVLSREVVYPLSGSGIYARLVLPRGFWDGNAYGVLNVINQSPNLFEEFSVLNNPVVNEASTIIRRNPEINTRFHRKSFNDDPENRVWYNPSDPYTPLTDEGIVSYNGVVARSYQYTYSCNEPACYGHIGYGLTYANFDSDDDTKTIRTFVYNGKPTITAKRFNNSITDNYLQTTNKEMYWTSEPYYLNVIRWMYHMDKDNNLYNPTAVDGQYKRPFTQQCSANIEWGIKDSMEQKYKTSKRNSENAVFATDKAFSHIAYPIRSGFYFNPCGEYEFTVETVTYKTTRADTKDHKDLVDALINSFRYETDMMFIDKNKNAVNLQNELLPRSGNSYARKSASLTAQDPTGVDGVTMLTVLDRDDEAWRYYKTVEELYHSQHENGDTHKALKEILEGYAESGTAASNQQFKYKEYIKDGQHIYKITERTTVTIRINHQNLRVYTHPHMPNGKYTVKAWLGDIDLSGMSSAYNRLGVYKSLDNLENIEVTVVGSMYNDINR